MKLQKTTAVTVLGVLNIVFAALGIFGVIGTLALFATSSGASNNPVIKIMHDNPGYALWMKMSIPMGLVACGALLVAGIGLLKLLPWARTVCIIYAIYAMVNVVLSTVINYFFLVRPMMEQAQGKSGAEAGAAIGGAVGGMVGGCIGLIYPIVLLIFMLRLRTVTAEETAQTV